jgi:opacity protein-like surface antigen
MDGSTVWRLLRGALAGFVTLAAAASLLYAQAVPSAFGPGHSLWVGGEYLNFNASFPYGSNQRISGIGAFADYHMSGSLAIEAQARFNRFQSYSGIAEDTYLGGGRYRLQRFGQIRPWGQCLVGIAHMQYPYKIGTMNYLALAPGAGADYSLGRKWLFTASYQYQLWLNSPNFRNEPQHGLRPNGFSAGIAYRIRR